MAAKSLACGDERFARRSKGKQTMSIRFDIAQRAAVSVIAALAFAGLAISAAVPVLPIA